MAARRLLLGLVAAGAGAAIGYQYALRSPEAIVDSSLSATGAAPGIEPVASLRASQDRNLAPGSSAREFAVGSLAEAIAQPTDFTQTVATYVLAAESDAAELQRLIAEADGMRHQGDRAAVLSILFSRYGDIDPRAALAYLDESGLSPKTNLIFTIFNSWSKRDLDGAIAEAHRRADPREQLVASDAILRAYEESGSATLADVRGRLPGGDNGAQNLNEIMRLATVDPEAAVARALRVSGVPREQVLAEVASRWAMQDPEAAYAYSNQIQDAGLRDWYQRGVFYRWAERDPERVIAILNEGLSRADETTIVNSAMRAMAAANPLAAFDRMDSIRDEAVRSAAYRVLLRTWAPNDPASAASAVAGLEDDSLRQQLAGTVVTSMVQQSPEAALDWARSLDDGYGPTWSTALLTIAETNPQLAINHAFSVASEADRNRSLVNVFSGLTQSSPETAAFYWPQIPDENTQSAVAMQIAGEWARRDASAAERWVLELPPGEMRENSLGRLVAGGSYSSFDTARLINTIGNEERRADMLRLPLLQLVRTEGPAAAEGLLNQIALPEARRRELAQTIREQAERN